MLIDIVDSYQLQIKAQMQLVDSTQQFGPVVQARDFPQTPIQDGWLYLLILQSNPKGGTESQVLYETFAQWVWLLSGDDLSSTQQGPNRGNRYRTDMKIKHNLRQASYPSFCQKQTYSADSQGNVTAVAAKSAIPVSQYESIWWSRLRFLPRFDAMKSGVLYGAAALEIYAWDDVVASVAA